MGTFHDDKGELHGITVVVDTDGEEIFVGRCDQVTSEGVILLDVERHTAGVDGRSKEDFVRRAARYGAWGEIRHLVVPRQRVTSIRRLGDVEIAD